MVTHPVRCVSCPRLVVGVCTPCVCRLPSAVCRCALRHSATGKTRTPLFCSFCSGSWPVFFFPCSVLVHMPYVNGASGRAPVGPLAGKGRGRGQGAKRRRGAASNKPLPSPSPVHVGAKKKLIWHAPRGGPRHPRGAGGDAREGGTPPLEGALGWENGCAGKRRN